MSKVRDYIKRVSVYNSKDQAYKEFYQLVSQMMEASGLFRYYMHFPSHILESYRGINDISYYNLDRMVFQFDLKVKDCSKIVKIADARNINKVRIKFDDRDHLNIDDLVFIKSDKVLENLVYKDLEIVIGLKINEIYEVIKYIKAEVPQFFEYKNS